MQCTRTVNFETDDEGRNWSVKFEDTEKRNFEMKDENEVLDVKTEKRNLEMKDENEVWDVKRQIREILRWRTKMESEMWRDVFHILYWKNKSSNWNIKALKWLLS